MNDNKGFKKRLIGKFLTIIISSNLNNIFSLKGLLSSVSHLLSFCKWGWPNETHHIVTEMRLCNKKWWQKVLKNEVMQQKLLTSCWRVDITWKNTAPLRKNLLWFKLLFIFQNQEWTLIVFNYFLVHRTFFKKGLV